MGSTRDQIIEKTCELLEIQGYHATGLNQIVSESGTPKGSLYYYFPGGKEELAKEAVTRVGEIVLGRIREHLKDPDDPADAVRDFIRNIGFNVERSGYRAGGPITTLAMESAASNEELRITCDRIYKAWQQAFADTLYQGGMGAPRAKSVASLIISAIEGGVILCRTGRSREPLERVADETHALIRAVL